MRIHTNTLTWRDLVLALPDGVYIQATEHGSRKRARAFEVTLYLYEKDELHRRVRNFNHTDDLGDVAATWDEWGIWMERLYDLDDSLVLPYYEDRLDFYRQTRRHRDYVRSFRKPTSIEYRTHTAPWLGE